MNSLFIFLGGGLGCLTRYFTTNLFTKIIKTSFFFPTFIANIIGCFIMGFLFYLFIDKLNISDQYKLFFTTGFCGGLTTFSGFSLDFIKLIQDGKTFTGISYILLTVIFSLLFIILGIQLAKTI